MHPIRYNESKGSAQCKSSIIFGGMRTEGKTVIKAKKSRNHTELMCKYLNLPVKVKNKNGIIKTRMVEVKPYKQVQEPKVQNRKTKRYINEVKTFAINTYKWRAARDFCEDRDWEFVIITEKELGLQSW